ncbi:hypothetical protein [Streptosporangium sp. NPDC004631]
MPGAPPWQPPPAFTAAAAGMQVWPSPVPDAHGTPRWPAATGEPIWSDPEETTGRPAEPGDVPVWPPSAIPPHDPGTDTVGVRTAGPAVPGHREPVDPAPPPGPAAQAAGATRDPSPTPEPSPQPPAPLPVPTSAPAFGPSLQPPIHPPVPAAHATEPGDPTSPAEPVESVESVDQPTPPGGIPVISPSFPPTPTPPASPPPTSGEVVLRGPFTPPSAVVVKPPAEPPPPVRSRGDIMLIATVVTLVISGIGTGAFFAYESFSAKKSVSAADPLSGSTPFDSEGGVTSPIEPDPINTEVLNSEKTDPGRLTVADAFAKRVTLAGTVFVRVKAETTQRCQETAVGQFADTLRSQDCRQVLRATYVDGRKKYAVTTGIAVLPTRESAVEVDQAKNLNSNLWFRGLPGASNSGAERVHMAGGYAAGLLWGRYIVFSYATFSDGHTPTAKEKALGRVSGAFRDETAKVVEHRLTG